MLMVGLILAPIHPAQPENLELLGDELGIKLQQIEASVGKFSVDILAQEENSDRRIIIENQLEQSLWHRHSRSSRA